MKKIIVFLTIFIGFVANAQTNVQVQYDFGRTNLVTTTLEGNYVDSWGSTYFFADFDLGKDIKGSYGEFSRSLNFWQNSKLKDLSAQVEFDAGVYKDFVVNPALLVGINYTFHDIEFKKWMLQFQVLYKTFFNKEHSVVPVQGTAVWSVFDTLGVKGLTFMGFADFWFQDQETSRGKRSVVFLSEPQLWYNVGRWIGVSNLDVGGEVEFGGNFDISSKYDFTVYPSAGIKWTF